MSQDLLEVRGTYEHVLVHEGGMGCCHTVSHIPCVMSVNSFYGGDARGKCVQLTIQGDHNYIQLTKADAVDLAAMLVKWAAGLM